MNFQDDIPSKPIDNSKDHYVLVFNLTSLRDSAENCHYAEVVGKPLRGELTFTFPLELVTEVIVLGVGMFLAAVDKFGVVGGRFKRDSVFLKRIFNHILPFKNRYLGCNPSDDVPTLDNDTFASINTQPSNMQGELWIMIAKFRHEMFLQALLDVKSAGSSNSITNRCYQHNYSLIPVFAVSTRSMQLFISSSSVRMKILELKILIYSFL